MKQLHQGLDYTLYQIYVWGGLALVVTFIVVSALVFDVLDLSAPWPFFALFGPVILYVTGILLYWWWVFLFKGNRELEALRDVPREGLPEIKDLQSWNTLHQAMSIHGGDVDELIENNKKARRPMLVWYGGANLLALWIFCPLLLGNLGILRTDGLPNNGLGIWLAGVFVWIVGMLGATPLLLRWGSKSAEHAYLAPLGLALTRTPGLTVDASGLLGDGQEAVPDGPAIVEGERHGRLVHIETVDKNSLTVVQAEVPPFTVQSAEGKLIPDEGAPEDAVKALKSLRKAKRWRGIAVNAGPEGIAVERQSKGTNMWLYDLWLAEYLANRTERPIPG